MIVIKSRYGKRYTSKVIARNNTPYASTGVSYPSGDPLKATLNVGIRNVEEEGNREVIEGYRFEFSLEEAKILIDNLSRYVGEVEKAIADKRETLNKIPE